MKKSIALVILTALIAVNARFMDYGVYVIENRAFPGVLTFVNSTNENGTITFVPPRVYELDVNSSSQRWRLDESALYTAFELRPTINENYVLEYVPESRLLRFFSHFGNTKLWYLIDSGDGFSAIKHKRYSVCLESTQNHGEVIANTCKGTFFQQWLLKPNVIKSA